jgi:hypothetical protein
MSLSMYQASVPVFLRTLSNLSAILQKAEAFAIADQADPAILLDGRIAPDMHPLPRQIQIATDSAKGGAGRLAGIDVPSFPDSETTFQDLQARIAKTIAFLETLTPAQIDGTEAKPIMLKLPSRELNFTGQSFLLQFALPNFFFHVTVAYAILRNEGVPLGKMDYLGGA